MPGSGKSTLGRMLAQQLEKRFFDSDDQIRQTSGLAPAKIITEQGESVFRDLEEQSIATLANVSGAVIATGGGAILRQINVQRIKRNGVVVFIDRPIDKLKAGKNRPLSADRAALKKRYAERYDKYVAAADVVIKPTLDKQENVQMMMNALQKVEW
jgi:shikimate dehydrogenase